MRSEDAARTKMDEENIKDIPNADHKHLRSPEREQEFVEEENYMADSVAARRFGIWTLKQEITQNIEKIRIYILTCEQDIQKREGILEDILIVMQERIEKRDEKLDQMYQDLLTPMQERLQKSKDETTKTTKTRHSTIKSLLLGSAFFASRFCSVGAEFIPVESDLSLCKTDLSKLTDTCDHDEVKAIHCVLNDEGEIGIGCFSKIWVEERYCPYFRNSFGVLDIRPCLGNSSICPRDQYLSNEVYKYPGCLINNSTRVLDILATQTTQSTTVRSSDAGDEESLLQIWAIVFIGLFSLFLLLIVGLGVLRWKTITSRRLRSAYTPASEGHQDPHRHGLPDNDVDV